MDNAEAACTFTAKTAEWSLPKDVLCLTLTLTSPVSVVGPSDISHLAPKTAGSGQVLEALASLSTATNVTLYLPRSPPD